MQFGTFEQGVKFVLAVSALYQSKFVEFELAAIEEFPVNLVVLLRFDDRLLKGSLVHLVDDRVVQRFDVVVERFVEEDIRTD
jgi:hypothetical protein